MSEKIQKAHSEGSTHQQRKVDDGRGGDLAAKIDPPPPPGGDPPPTDRDCDDK